MTPPLLRKKQPVNMDRTIAAVVAVLKPAMDSMKPRVFAPRVIAVRNDEMISSVLMTAAAAHSSL